MSLKLPVTNRFTAEQELALLSLYFTNPAGDISFVVGNWDFGPEEQAAEAAKYSRTHTPYQERVLKQIAREPELDMDFIQALAANPEAGRLTLLKRAKALAGQFHKRWSLGLSEEDRDTAVREYGHNSIKEAANCLYVCEDILDIDSQIILADPLNRPQVKSTRYIDWTSLLEKQIDNPDIKASRFADLIVESLTKLNAAYCSFTERLAKAVEQSKISTRFLEEFLLCPAYLQQAIDEEAKKRSQKDPQFKRSSGNEAELAKAARDKILRYYRDYARKSVFDSTRYLLAPSILTSMAVAGDARSLERNITELLSSPLRSAVQLGERLQAEGEKLMPALVGRHSHAQRSEFITGLREELRTFAKRNFEFEKSGKYEVTPRAHFSAQRLISLPWDAQAAIFTMFEYCNGSVAQIADHFEKNPGDIKRVCDIAYAKRGRFDPLPHGLGHVGQTTHETLMDYGAYRDLHRHRRGTKTRQLITAAHGFETPELFVIAGLDGEYGKVLSEMQQACMTVAAEEPDTAQLMVPFAFKHRTIWSWNLEQHGYVAELRGRPSANPSYQTVAWDIFDMVQAEAPEFSRLIRVPKISYPADLINLREARDWYDKTVR